MTCGHYSRKIDFLDPLTVAQNVAKEMRPKDPGPEVQKNGRLT